MRFLLVFAFLVPMSYLHSDEPSFTFTFGGNIKNFPIQFNRSDKKIKKMFSVNFNKWNISPTFNSFANTKFTPESIKNKNLDEKLFVKLKFKF
jgi:hypothetical protein